MNKYRLMITTILGETSTSEWSESSVEDIDKFAKFLKKLKNLDNLYMEVPGGKTIYFNPDHVVSVTIQKENEDG